MTDIGLRIADDEADMLLLWAVRGAVRLLRQGRYTQPASSKTALAEFATTDPVHTFVGECCAVGAGGEVTAVELYEEFKLWAEIAGFTPYNRPTRPDFWRRVKPILEAQGAAHTSNLPTSGRARRAGYRGVSLRNLSHADDDTDMCLDSADGDEGADDLSF